MADGTLRLLIVHSDPNRANALAELLRRWQYQVQACRTAAEAVQTVATFAPNVVLMEAGSPEDSLPDLAQRLRRSALLALMGEEAAITRLADQIGGFVFRLPEPIDRGDLRQNLLQADIWQVNRVFESRPPLAAYLSRRSAASRPVPPGIASSAAPPASPRQDA